MTYAERIERVARALASVNDEEWARTRAETKEYFREQARAADCAVLEAIAEPTQRMKEIARALDGPHDEYACGESHWEVMHAAIPRGEEAEPSQ